MQTLNCQKFLSQLEILVLGGKESTSTYTGFGGCVLGYLLTTPIIPFGLTLGADDSSWS